MKDPIQRWGKRWAFRSKRLAVEPFRWVFSTPEEHTTVWKAAKFGVLTLPGIVMAFLTTTIGSHPLPGQSSVVAWFADRPSWIIGLIVLPGALSFFAELFEEKCAKANAQTNIDSDEFFVILTSIEEVVAKKRTAVWNAAKEARQSSPPLQRKAAMACLSRPEEHITECVNQLYNCLREITGDTGINVALVPIRNGVPVAQGAIFLPTQSAPSTELFEDSNAKKTLFFHVAKDRESQYIKDLEEYFHSSPKSKRTYLFMREEVDSGSILCVPIVDPGTNKTAFAISILSSQSGLFCKQSLKKYEAITGYFRSRILMEYALKIILTSTDDQ